MQGECSKDSLPPVKRQPAGEREYPRLFRDIHAAGMQLSPSWDVAGSIYSRVMFGMPPGQQIQRLLRQFVDYKSNQTYLKFSVEFEFRESDKR